MITAAEAPAQRGVGKDVPGTGRETLRPDAVECRVGAHHVGGLRVDIAAQAALGTQHQRADAEDAAAAAQVEYPGILVYILFKFRQTHARGGVAAGSEDETRIQAQRRPAIPRDLLPFRHDHQLLPDGDGFVIFAPVVLPVAVLHKADLDLAVGGADLPQGVLPGLIVGQIAFDAADTGILLLQLPIHVIPVLVIILQKVLKIGLVFDHKTAHSHGAHLFTALIQKLLRGIDDDFNVSHIPSPWTFFLILPQAWGKVQRRLACSRQNAGSGRGEKLSFLSQFVEDAN